jgi:hypothetical protein
VVLLALLLTAWPLGAPASPAQADCRLVLGFKALHDLIPQIVGDCLENEHHNPENGDALQQTTGGLLVWRKADNWTAFTDGSTSWINGPSGLQSRPNSGPLFAWETGAPADPLAAASGVLLADDFDDAEAGKLPVVAASLSRADRGYLGGEYLIRKRDPAMERSPKSLLPGAYADATLAVDARLVGPTDDRVVSIACRDQGGPSGAHYRFEVRPATSQFALTRWDGEARVALLEWQISAAIQPGNVVNHLELSCVGATISASVNMTTLASLQDAAYASGRWWIGAGDLQSPPATVEVRFDNLVLRQG